MSVGLLLIRHAETDAAGTFCGHADPPVNARGTAQIEELVAKLACYQVEVVYSSDLRRALATAEAVATYFSVPLKTTSNLREIGFGDWENATWSEIEVRDPAYAKPLDGGISKTGCSPWRGVRLFRGESTQGMGRDCGLAPEGCHRDSRWGIARVLDPTVRTN